MTLSHKPLFCFLENWLRLESLEQGMKQKGKEQLPVKVDIIRPKSM